MGMRVLRLEIRDYVSGRLPSEIWEITAEEWQVWKLLHPAGYLAGRKRERASRRQPAASAKRISPAQKAL
jgi:hypothetical protein